MWTFNAVHSGAYDLAALSALAASVDGWYNEALLPLLPSAVLYEGITVRGLSEEEDLRYDLSEPLPGTDVDGACPAQVAVVITKRTGFTGRSARGRSYLWGIPLSYREDDRHITDFAASAYAEAFDTLTAAVEDADFEPIVLSYFTAGAPRVTATWKSIISWEIRDKRLDTQRRRLGRS